MTSSRHADWRLWLLFAIAVVGTVAVVLHGPILQDASYHRFADQRRLLGIPNFWNVVSNLPFVAVGVVGVAAVTSSRSRGLLRPLQRSYIAFFLASILVGFGSAYYHLNPGDTTLVWDRLPMTLAFMAFVSVILGEHISVALGRNVLFPLLAAGLASVLWWSIRGDLRAYVLVQYLPAVLIPLIVALFQSPFTHVPLIWAVLAGYVLAKTFELFDGPVYGALGISGHTLKHVAAAGGMFLFVVAIRKRRLREPGVGLA